MATETLDDRKLPLEGGNDDVAVTEPKPEAEPGHGEETRDDSVEEEKVGESTEEKEAEMVNEVDKNDDVDTLEKGNEVVEYGDVDAVEKSNDGGENGDVDAVEKNDVEHEHDDVDDVEKYNEEGERDDMDTTVEKEDEHDDVDDAVEKEDEHDDVDDAAKEDEHDDVEKEDGDEDEDEIEEGSKLPKKGSESEALEKKGGKEKDPVTPVSDRPTRERKMVERYSIPSPSKSRRSSSSKGFTIEKGRGTQLKDIPNVAFKLSKRKPDDNLHMLHNLLFGKKTKTHTLKRNIGQFSGYLWVENEEKQRAKLKERIDKCVKEKLLDFCDVLNIPINKGNVKKEELSVKLLEFLESPHATTDVLLADKEQKGKKRTAKVTPNKSSGEASIETSAKKQKKTSQDGKKRKQLSDNEEDDKAQNSDAEDESQEDEDVAAVPNKESDIDKSESEEEEEKPKAHKRTPKKIVKEGSVAKAEESTPSVKKTSVKASKSNEKTPKNSSSKKTVTGSASASSKSKQPEPASKKQKTVKGKPETKAKAASKKQTDKSSKALVKDQGKGKSSKKAKVAEPSREEMHAVVVDILKEVDFNTATLSDILRQLGTNFGLDLMHRKAEVKDIITDVINNMSDEEDEEEETANDGDGDADKDDGDGDADKDDGDGDDDEDGNDSDDA